MAAENTPKGEIDKLSEKLSMVAVEDEEQSAEKDLFVIAEALVDIFHHWKCNESDCKKYLGEIRLIYRNCLGNKRERPDFSDKNKQWCYMFLYMLNHSYLLFYSIKRAVEAKVINVNPNENPLDVCVIGGGPGSDILGLCLLLNAKNCVKPWIRDVNVLDKYVEWEESWKQINEHLPRYLKDNIGNVTYSHFDFLVEALDECNQEKIEAAHVVTMTKALSTAVAFLKDIPPKPEVQRSSEKTERNSVFSILETMRNGAILLFLDNNVGKQYDILMNEQKRLGFEVLLDISIHNVTVPKYYEVIDKNLRDSLSYNASRGSKDEKFVILKKSGKLSEKVKLEANMNMVSQTKSPKAEFTHVKVVAGEETKVS